MHNPRCRPALHCAFPLCTPQTSFAPPSADVESSVRSAISIATGARRSAKLRRSGMCPSWADHYRKSVSARASFMPLLRSLPRASGTGVTIHMALLGELDPSAMLQETRKLQSHPPHLLPSHFGLRTSSLGGGTLRGESSTLEVGSRPSDSCLQPSVLGFPSDFGFRI
jgi:hypothetical protein